jgi:hypothetical protein
MTHGKASDVLPDLISASVRDPNLRTSLDEYIRYRRRPLSTILGRGLQRGELAADTDVDVLIDVLIGPFTYRRLLTHDPRSTTTTSPASYERSSRPSELGPVVLLAGRLVVGCRDGQRLPDIDRPTRRHSLRLP